MLKETKIEWTIGFVDILLIIGGISILQSIFWLPKNLRSFIDKH